MPRRLVINEADDVVPSLPLAGAIVAAEALDGMEQAAEVQRAAVGESRRLGQALLAASPWRSAGGGLEEAGVVEEEGIRVSGGGAGEEAVDGLPLGGEGERGDIEGLGRRPGRRRHDAADAVGLGERANASDVGERIGEFLLRGAEHRRFGYEASAAAGAGGRGGGGGGREGPAFAHRRRLGQPRVSASRSDWGIFFREGCFSKIGRAHV